MPVPTAAAATVTPNGLGRGLIDGRNKEPVADGVMTSITIFANDATTATAFALAAYAVGPKHGIVYVEKHPEVKGVMVDNGGQLVASNGLGSTNKTITNRWPAEGTNRGPNNLGQKRREEASDR